MAPIYNHYNVNYHQIYFQPMSMLVTVYGQGSIYKLYEILKYCL